MLGQELFETLIQNTGLPESFIGPRLEKLILAKGQTLDQLDINQVRELLSDLLLDLINESLDSEIQDVPPSPMALSPGRQ